MKVRGLICCAESVRGFLDGRKTQTRRVINPQPDDVIPCGQIEDSHTHLSVFRTPTCRVQMPLISSYQVGDVLYVREALKPYSEWDTTTGYHYHDLVYAATSDNDSVVAVTPERLECAFDYGGHWQRGSTGVERRWVLIPSIHMPKWAARIWHEVTAVRVERVQDISGADIYAEGCPREIAELPPEDEHHESFAWFIRLWNILHGPGAWERNDWVSVYDLKPTEKPDAPTD